MTRRSRSTAAALLLAGAAIAGVGAPSETGPGFAFVPKHGRGPFPVVVWLHGYRGWSPDGYFPGATREAMQKHADAIDAVVVGFPGDVRLADGSYRWSEDPAADDAYVRARLKGIAATLDLDLSRVALFGFSEGGLVAAELATIRPDRYLGAIVMSPGGRTASRVAARPHPEHARQVYLFFCNAGEDPAVVALTKKLAAHARDALGATVRVEISAGSLHARPPGFIRRFPIWAREILDSAP